MILARVPDPKTLSLPKGSAILRAIQQGNEDPFRGVSTVDGIERLFRFRKVGTYPVFLSYGISIQTVLNQWQKDLLFHGVFLGFAALTLAGIALLALRRAQREISAVQERRRAEAQMQELRSELLHVSRLAAMGADGPVLAHELTSPWPRRPIISAQQSACPSLMEAGRPLSSTRQASRSCAPARSSSAFVTSSPKASLPAGLRTSDLC